MHLPTLLLYVLCHVSGASAQPALPDLGSLVYSASTLSTIPPNKRGDWKERIEEGVALAKFLDRMRDRWVVNGVVTSPDGCLNIVTVLQQFDSALNNLNSTPSVEEAVARVRVYREWLGILYRSIECARGVGENSDYTDRNFERAIRQFEENYGPLFSQDFRHCDPSRIPALPESPAPPPLAPLPGLLPPAPVLPPTTPETPVANPR